MAQQQGAWPGSATSVPGSATPVPGWVPPGPGPRPPEVPLRPPPRPVYREPHPVGAGALISGLGAGLFWVALFGALGRDLFGYAWWTLAGAGSAWAVALVLARNGDRGVATGVAISAGLGWAVTAGFIAGRWITTGDWPMW